MNRILNKAKDNNILPLIPLKVMTRNKNWETSC